MTDRAPPPASSWRSRFFAPLPAAPGATVIPFPPSRIVRQPPRSSSIACASPGDRVSFNYRGEAEHFSGTVAAVAIAHGFMRYTIACDDGLTRVLEVPL